MYSSRGKDADGFTERGPLWSTAPLQQPLHKTTNEAQHDKIEHRDDSEQGIRAECNCERCIEKAEYGYADQVDDKWSFGGHGVPNTLTELS